MPPETDNASADQRLFKALGHPLRRRILEALNEQESSPSQLAERLGEPLGNVSYHVKILEQSGAAELIKTEPVRGAIEHFYRPTARAAVSSAPLELDEQGCNEVAQLLDETLGRARELEIAARKRLSSGAGTIRRTELAVLHFERGE
jgi:DNA-binding transcriptional ArsR family regulator